MAPRSKTWFYLNYHFSRCIYSKNLVVDPQLHGECSIAFDSDIGSAHDISVRCHSIIKVQNPNDRLCLARAINIGLKYRMCGEQRWHPDFKNYIEKQHLHIQRLAAEMLLLEAKISATKLVYTTEDAKKIQESINKRYGEHQIRLVIFSADKNNGIVWKGWNGVPAKFDLCLYHSKEHFSFLSSPKALLNVFLLKTIANTIPFLIFLGT